MCPELLVYAVVIVLGEEMEIDGGEGGALSGRRRRRHNRKRCINIIMSFGERGKDATILERIFRF
jgi:hypothetical protein